MRWSWKIGRFAGIDVYIHTTFLLLIVWVVAIHWIAHHSLRDAASGVLFILVLFACVVLHEFGHALTARHYGIPTKDITLLPIGGVSRFDRLPEKPWQEFWVSIAGPLVNAVIGLILWIALFVTGSFKPVTNLSMANGPFLERMMVANIALAVFNVIPAFPMDGGRILRALLSTRMDHVRATQTAAAIGQGLALLFGFVGLFYDPFLLFIALFVWIGAAHESQSVQIKDAFSGIPIRNIMQTHFSTLTTADTLGRAMNVMLEGSQHDFPVMWGETIMGMLGRANLLSGLQEFGPEELVTKVMQREFATAEPREMLETVLGRLASSSSRAMPVLDDGKLIGLVTLEHLGEYLMVQKALHRRKAALASHIRPEPRP